MGEKGYKAKGVRVRVRVRFRVRFRVSVRVRVGGEGLKCVLKCLLDPLKLTRYMHVLLYLACIKFLVFYP